jgi:hypothetical protein
VVILCSIEKGKEEEKEEEERQKGKYFSFHLL